MSDEPSPVFGSAVCSYIVVNQIKEHYLAASELLKGRVDRQGFRFWMVGQVLDACSKAIETAVDRIKSQKGIQRQHKEGNRDFHMRVCREAGLGLGQKTLAQLKKLIRHWDDHKHSGEGERWKENANLRTATFTLDSFHLTTAFLAACYRLFDRPEEPSWLRQAEIRDGEIHLSALSSSEIDQLLVDWEITAPRPPTA